MAQQYKYGLKEVANVTFYDTTTEVPVLLFDTLKVSTIENAAENVYAMGGQGAPKLVGWDFGRTATVTLEDALLSIEGMGLLTGSFGANASAANPMVIYRNKDVACVGGIANFALSAPEALDLLYANVLGYAVKDANGILSAFVSNTTNSGANSYINAGVVGTGTETVKVFYKLNKVNTTNNSFVDISANKFPGTYRVVGDTVIRQQADGKDYAFQFVIPRAKLQAGFTLTMQAEGDPTSITLTLDVLKPVSSEPMIKLIRYGLSDGSAGSLNPA